MFIFHMDYIELDLDSAVATQSVFKDNSSLDTPVFELGRDLQNVVGFKIIETNIPSSYYLINDQTKGPWGYVGGLVAAEWGSHSPIEGLGPSTYIPANQAWTGPTLAAQLQTAWSALIDPVLTCTVVYSNVTGRFTITITRSTPLSNPTTVPLVFYDDTTAKMFGFLPASYYYYTPPDQPYPDNIQFESTSDQTWSWTSPYIALPTGPNYLQINSLKLCNLLLNYVPEGPLGTVGQTLEKSIFRLRLVRVSLVHRICTSFNYFTRYNHV